MSHQSTNHIFMLEPVAFRSNPETMDTNAFQHEDNKTAAEIQKKALSEFRAFRDLLVEHGVTVTTAKAAKGTPDDIFCNNWVSTHESRRMALYPMMAKNRRMERRRDLVELIRKGYADVLDFSAHEQHSKALESTGALCLDRVNKVAYSNVSKRSDEDVAKLWAKTFEYELVRFETDFEGQPVYHADVVMWIGTGVAGVCSKVIKDKTVIDRLSKTHDIVEFTNRQMQSFCGNSLEVVGRDGEKMLVMSSGGAKALTKAQKDQLGKYYKTIISPKIPTIEYFGGGSARCMMLELF